MKTKRILGFLVFLGGLLLAASAQASVNWSIVGTADGEPVLIGTVTTPDIPAACDDTPVICGVSGTLTIPDGALGGTGTTIDLAIDPLGVFFEINFSPPGPTDDFNLSGISKDGYVCDGIEPFLLQCTHTTTATFHLALSQARVVIGNGNVVMTGQLEVAGQIIEPVADTTCSVAECNAEGVTTLTCGATEVEIACAVPPTLYAIGDEGPAGGIVFYIIPGGQHGLEAALEDQDGGTGVQWGCYETDITSADRTYVGGGEANTLDILQPQISGGCETRPIAASVAADYTGPRGDTSGWFLPSKDELNLIYENKDMIGGFAGVTYWSSSEVNASTAQTQELILGVQYGDYSKNFSGRVRAVRAF